MIVRTVYNHSQGHWTLAKLTSTFSLKTAAVCAGVCLAGLTLFNAYQGRGISPSLITLTGSLLTGLAGGVFSATRKVFSSPESTTSGYLRWMNIWLDAQERGLTGPGKDVLVLGPGKRQFGKVEHCPQMAEAFKIWDGSSFTVFE